MVAGADDPAREVTCDTVTGLDALAHDELTCVPVAIPDALTTEEVTCDTVTGPNETARDVLTRVEVAPPLPFGKPVTVTVTHPVEEGKGTVTGLPMVVGLTVELTGIVTPRLVALIVIVTDLPVEVTAVATGLLVIQELTGIVTGIPLVFEGTGQSTELPMEVYELYTGIVTWLP